MFRTMNVIYVLPYFLTRNTFLARRLSSRVDVNVCSTVMYICRVRTQSGDILTTKNEKERKLTFQSGKTKVQKVFLKSEM